MSMDKDVERIIEAYLKKVRKALPESFETDDLVEDLREHIHESFDDKRSREPSEDNFTIIQTVLGELGDPDEIAHEFNAKSKTEDESEDTGRSKLYFVTRLLVAIIVVLIAAWIASSITEGFLNFGYTAIILLIFVVAEWFVTSWQAGETSPLDILKSK